MKRERKNKKMVVARDLFTISSDIHKKVSEILEREAEKRNKSHFICQAILEKEERDKERKIDEFVTPETELDLVPRANEPLSTDYLSTLNPADVGKLERMLYWNIEVVGKYIASLQRKRGFIASSSMTRQQQQQHEVNGDDSLR